MMAAQSDINPKIEAILSYQIPALMYASALS